MAVADAIQNEISEPTSSMRKSFENLDRPHQDLLISLLDTGGGVISADEAELRV